jgi:4-alpha-glucanotransferase
MIARRNGILLHITSLPSPHGIGDLGPESYHFADFLHAAGQSLWQVLPLNPTSTVNGDSPYSSCSAFAGNPLFISLDRLVEDGFLAAAELENVPSFSAERVDYVAATAYKLHCLRRAAAGFRETGQVKDPGFPAFCSANAWWLDPFTLFVALKEHFAGAPWYEWPRQLRDREGAAVAEMKERLAEKIFQEMFFQYTFSRQWNELKDYCNQRSIQLVGDMPIYVSLDSADVWCTPGAFKLDGEKRPVFVSGVPPDYFSATGQRWGNPVYDWDALKKDRYAWWIKRFEYTLKLFDLVRIDHFRGLVGYWEIPAAEATAVTGKWVEAPARDLFNTLLRHFSILPIIAEDLGMITADVREIMHSFRFPGMKILQFAYYGDVAANPYAPHNHVNHCVVYTGTHDNNTTRGWFRKELSASDKAQLVQYLGCSVDENDIHWHMIRMAMMSVANTCIVPLQDYLGLDEAARMNLPAIAKGNWQWRFRREELTPDLALKISRLTRLYGRG